MHSEGSATGTVWPTVYAAAMAKHTSVEKCFEIIESAVEALEGDELSLDDALGKYEEGLKFLRQAKKQLDAYEARLETLNAKLDDEDDEA